jgi:hypothetical protein
MSHKLFYAFLFFVGFVILVKYFCQWPTEEERPNEDVDDFFVMGSSYYDRPNCFKNVFGQKVCYPNRYGYPYYYYPYVRAESTWIRRHPHEARQHAPVYWNGTNRIQYWKRY